MKHSVIFATCVALFFSVIIILIAQPPLKESSPAVKTALTQVISSQIEAFRANDYPRAFTFASSDLRRQFAPAAFEQMVQKGFPIIAHSTTNEFGVALDDGEEGVVFVKVGDAQGNHQIYRYTLQHENDGWKITGVTQSDAPTPATDSPFTT